MSLRNFCSKRCTRGTFMCITFFLVLLIYTSQNYILSLTGIGTQKKNFNYFFPSSELTKDFLVESNFCKIKNFSAFHPTILEFIQPPTNYNCERIYGRLTYVNKTNVIINMTVLDEWGYSFDSLHCCFKVVRRIEQTLDNYDESADKVSVLSDQCYKLDTIVTPVVDEFIKTLAVENKIKYWKSHKKLPPNVIIMGMDSVSRLSSIRNLPLTREYLTSLGSVEMLGHTKVGENTFPNAVAFMTGYSEKELSKICYFKPTTAQDLCPFIWKQFSTANYLTAYFEDSPSLGNYNYLKTGFVQQPADYYLRPMMQQIYEEKNFIIFGSYQRSTVHCGGPQEPFKKLYEYMADLFEISKEVKTPVFLNTWQTGMTHDDMNQLKGADLYLRNFLTDMKLNESESNSILFVLSDHGYRFGQFRETHIGWYEDKLPWLSIFLPPKIRAEFPDWVKALEINSRRLTSPFDLYHTWTHILQQFSGIKPQADNVVNGTTIPRLFGQSLFKIVSEDRTCSSVGIDSAFCSCYNPIQVPLDDPDISQGVKVALFYINNMLPEKCAQLKLNKIIAAAKDQVEQNLKILIVGFIVNPGYFRFEATVNVKNDSFSVDGDVLRTSSINTDVSCVHTSILERYCYCLS